MTPRLHMHSVEKAFGATRALRRVSFEVRPGEVHALIGENGAGKSTLMKILSGAHQPDAGRIEIDGQPFQPENPHHARQRGIAMIYQELNLAPHLSAEENIALGAEPSTFGWIHSKRRRQIVRNALAELRHDSIPLDVPVRALSVAEQQVIEIARALIGESKILILDEPTSSLTRTDAANLFAVIARLRARGVSVIYISHFLEECRRICDRYTVLRDGETVGTGEMASANPGEIIRLMIGRDLTEIYPRIPHTAGKPVFELKNLSGKIKPRSVTLTLREGEIFGLAGLIGAGRTETLRTCFGLDRVQGGTVLVRGRESTRAAPPLRLAQGIGLLSENRKEEGLMQNRSVAENLTLTRLKSFSRLGVLKLREETRVAGALLEQLGIRARHPRQPVSELSGGNQQKVAVGRLLHHDATVFLLDEPTRGIDVGSKAQVYAWMGKLASEGKAVLFVSSYLPELLGVCDTIGVMCRGVLVETRPASEWTEHEIIRAAIGRKES